MYKYTRISSEDDDELPKSLLRGKSKSPIDNSDDGKNIHLCSIVVRTEAVMTDTGDTSRIIAVDITTVSSGDGVADTTLLWVILQPLMYSRLWGFYWTKYLNLLRILCCVATQIMVIAVVLLSLSLFTTVAFFSIHYGASF